MTKVGRIILILFLSSQFANSQDSLRPSLGVQIIEGSIQIDGKLDESEWNNGPSTTEFRMVEPAEGAKPTAQTEVRVLATEKAIIFGIRCDDPSPNDIVRFSKLRDASLRNEDHIRIVLDPFLDGQSGYIFAVNANGARYDALVSNRGESENNDWDAIWEAAATVDQSGWSVEIKIPIQSIYFKKGLTQWGFNIERRIQRNQEIIRWANARRDQWLIQTSRSGFLTGLPPFNYGLGLNVRPSIVSSSSKEIGQDANFNLEPSLDASQRIGPNILATVTVNTDFAETEVDSRRTNLTRFPLFFPEKRSFFLEGSDIFEFGLGTGSRTLLPFFSRRIGLLEGSEVPILAGAKINGRAGKTAFGGLSIRTRDHEMADGSVLDGNTMSVFRARQNIFSESSVGIISSFGDPLGRSGSWTSGADFNYQTTRFKGNKNFLVGGWALLANREDLSGDRSALGLKVDYPNDLWDLSFTYFRIGENFDPSLGFIPRKGINYVRGAMNYAPRPKLPWLRQMFHELFITYISELDGNWQSYAIFTAPINWRLESGERIEINVYPQGENLSGAFEIADGVIIPAGQYHFTRYRVETEFAAKRRLNGQLSWWLGSFYEGTLSEIEAEVNWNPSQLVTFEFNGQRNIGKLPWGNFDQSLAGLRVRFNVTPDLQLNSFLQYDTESRQLGWNARLHWIFSPLGDVFLVFNNNTLDDLNRGWTQQSQQLILKMRYNFRV